jgi:subtilisin family serine protease
MRRAAAVRTTTGLLLGALLLGALQAVAVAQSLPPTPERTEWHASNDDGHWSDWAQDRVRIDAGCQGLGEAEAVACSLAAFRSKPFVVIAFVDSGINPYHDDFRAPEFVHHPATFLEGYPADATPLTLSLDLADTDGYDAAVEADDEAWLGVERGQLRWIPGTRIVGGISIANGGTVAGRSERMIRDDQGHGTGVASVAAGRWYGSNPDALIVMVEGLGDAALTWATAQPWIDIVSNSWGPGLPGRVSTGSVAGTRAAVARGQTVLFSAGNGMYNTNSSDVWPAAVPVEDPCKCKIPPPNVSTTSHYGGPSWVMSVGAASPVNGQAHWWHGVPVDVMSFGSKWAAAAAFGVRRDDNRDFGGTSCATPITAGVLSAVIQRARAEFGDTVSGQRADRPGVVAEAAPGADLPPAGPLSDGTFTQADARLLVERAAEPVAADPDRLTWDYAVVPTTTASWVHQGYGLVDRDARVRSLAYLLGEVEVPERAEAARWQTLMDAHRDLLYGAP